MNGSKIFVRCSDHNRKPPQWFDPGFEATREWNNDDVANLVYMI